ncbi:hypothetical protein, partial [Parapusillimonas granuli]|uniref:hypothetical protein n=1 Tax=Parapusillimonas granuli TaxID=380911 RepID=UPI001C551845
RLGMSCHDALVPIHLSIHLLYLRKAGGEFSMIPTGDYWMTDDKPRSRQRLEASRQTGRKSCEGR